MPSAANETVRPNSFLRLNEEFLPLWQRGERCLKEMLERISETERNDFGEHSSISVTARMRFNYDSFRTCKKKMCGIVRTLFFRLSSKYGCL